MSAATAKSKPGRNLPILNGILPLVSSQIPTDVIAGVTLAALAIPEVMGYTKIAGMPVITGLYTIVIPIALFALFGSSRHLVVGADSATAAIMAAGLAGMAAVASPQYVALAGVLALMAAGLLILARLLNLGFLADFLSRTVLIGFLTGVGIQVAIGQISGMLGIPGGGAGPIQKLVTDVQQLGQINWPTLAVSVGVLGTILILRRINKKIPGALIAVIGAIVLSYALNLSSNYGVAVLGTVPSGLPSIGLPDVTINWSLIQRLLPTAISMFIVILAQSAATSRAYATRYNERFSENVDLVGLGLANIGAGLSGTFVVNGSPTKTQMVDSAGGRSQLSMLVTAAIVVIVLLFLTVPLSFMPEAVLSSVVFMIGVELVDYKGMRRILAERPMEFWVAAITAAVVVFIGVEQGIILAILLSLLAHTSFGYKPKNSTLFESDGALKVVPIADAQEAVPGLVMYRFNHSMYYANSELLAQELSKLAQLGPDPVKWLCCDLIAVDEIDFSAAATLRESAKELKDKGVKLVFSSASEQVRQNLDVSGVTEAVGQDAFFPDLEAVLSAYKAQTA
ncbi:MAG: SulP family inorganic anion transporter [Caldilineales bacterium]|nr:SulP family inorganic anion transporter [Caldilineales bacterium]